MRIAFIVGYFPAASETFILNQITGLIDRGHEVDIYAHRAGAGTAHSDVTTYGLLPRTHYWGLPATKSMRALKGLGLMLARAWRAPLVAAGSLNLFRHGKLSASMILPFAAMTLQPRRAYHVIHAHFGPNGLLAAALRQLGLLEGKLITTFHGYDVTSLVKKEGPDLYDRLFRDGDLFLPISETWQQRLLEMGCPPDRLKVHHMGIDCGRFAFSPRRLGENGVARLVSVARLVEKKGIEYALRAIARLFDRGQRVQYQIIGDGPLRMNLEHLVHELGIHGLVHFRGWRPQSEVLELLDQADIFLAPSVVSADGDQEGIPVVLMEAMALGMPVVSTRHSGIPELVDDGRSGVLVPERNVEALADRIAYLVTNPHLWATMGSAGRAHVECHFSIQKLNDELVRAYQRLIALPSP